MAQRVFSLHNAAMGVLAAGLLMTPAIPRAKADLWNQQTTFSFNQPVEIPGKVLGPGTYVFQLASNETDRNVIQVFNQDGNHLIATEMTVPTYRMNPTGKTVLTFEERAAGSPQAIHNWYYPGMLYGHEFVYHGSTK